MTIAFFSLGLSVILLLVSFIFKIAGKTRLTLPVIYFLVATISTMFSDWVTLHEKGVIIGFFVLTILCLGSWIVTLIHFIQDKRYEKFVEDDLKWQIDTAREHGNYNGHATLSESGDLIDPETGKPIWQK